MGVYECQVGGMGHIWQVFPIARQQRDARQNSLSNTSDPHLGAHCAMLDAGLPAPLQAESAPSEFPREPFNCVKHLRVPEAAKSLRTRRTLGKASSGSLPKMSANSAGEGGLASAGH